MGSGARSASAGVTPAEVSVVQRFPVISFFVMALGFTWLAVSPMLLARAGVIEVDLPVELVQIVGALAGPTLAGLIVSAAVGGREGVGRLLRRVVQWRVGIVWYVLLLFGPLIALTLTATAFFGGQFLADFLRSMVFLPSQYLPILILGVILGPLWEEIGWRGFALPRLQHRVGPLQGTIILGMLWAIWHLPGYLGGWLGAFTPSAFLAMIIASIGFSIVMTWVYNHTGESLLIMILLHSASNASIAFGGRFLPTMMADNVRAMVQSGWIPAITYAGSAIIIILATRGRLAFAGEKV
jgi:membrane protease YdiL (CAAX protease family)